MTESVRQEWAVACSAQLKNKTQIRVTRLSAAYQTQWLAVPLLPPPGHSPAFPAAAAAAAAAAGPPHRTASTRRQRRLQRLQRRCPTPAARASARAVGTSCRVGGSRQGVRAKTTARLARCVARSSSAVCPRQPNGHSLSGLAKAFARLVPTHARAASHRMQPHACRALTPCRT